MLGGAGAAILELEANQSELSDIAEEEDDFSQSESESHKVQIHHRVTSQAPNVAATHYSPV